ncbi:MAG: hypothetical protein ACT4PI_01830 [Actinomycetota bacterium]
MKTVGAIVAAVAMVVAAVVIRNNIDDARNTDGDAQLVCATELEEACTQLDDAVGGLDVTIEPAGVTALRLSALPDSEVDDPGLDGWLVPDPWPAIVADTRARAQLAPVLEDSTTPLARTPLVIVALQDRARVLEEGPCAGTIDWRCLGDVGGEAWEDLNGPATWNRVKVVQPNPMTSATGLVLLAQAASEFFGRIDYALNDLQQDDFVAWLERLTDTGAAPDSPVEEMVSAVPTALYDAAGATEAEAGPLLANAVPDRRNAFTLLYPEPVATADVVLALTVTQDRDDDIADLAAGGRARDELAESGWRVEGRDPVKGVRTRVRLPAGTNLPPDAGIYIALQNSWGQATG